MKLSDVTRVILEPEIPGSTRIDTIWLETSGGTRIRYRDRFPYSDAIRELQPDYSLLVDQSNRVWAVSTNGGDDLLARSYFEEYHFETKVIGKYGGGLMGFFAAWFLFTFAVCEKQFRAGKPLPDTATTLVPLGPLILLGCVYGYMVLWVVVLFPLLARTMSVALIPFVWVFGTALVWNLVARYLQKHSPRQNSPN